MKRILILLAAALTIAACHPETGFDKTQIADATVRMSVKKSEVFSYDELKCQMSYNKSLKQFRAGTDNMSDYFVVKMSAVPTRSGQTLSADVEWTTSTSINTLLSVPFEVVQMDSDNNAWLWSARQDISVVIRILQ
ncbi:MAG: hypothetical protein MJZ04_04860 [Bacteroidales bacterium]|nr:hypothetical protein [Bacteroidales bacterium]